MSRSIRASGLVAVAAASAAPAAFAHGFGQRYDLPLPLWLYLWATAAAIALSFVVAAGFLRRAAPARAYPQIDLLGHPLVRRIANRRVAAALASASLLLFGVVVAAGFVGSQDPYRNIAPTLVWIVGWVGLAYVSAFVGDVWALINPWRTLFALAERLHRRMRAGRELSRDMAWPEWLGVWPAFALLFAFSWTELVYPSPALPQHVAWLIVGYSILTFAGMAAFGREQWLEHAELFTVLYGVLARFAPIDAREGRLVLRPFAAGLLDAGEASASMTAFVLLILASVLYDGVLGTPQWIELEARLAALAPGSPEAASLALRTLGLAGFWAAFFGAYLAVCALMSAVAGGASAWRVARSFAFTLVPIAIAYHLAHYLTYLLIQGQYVVPLASDPFGFGWNLFGTAGYRVDIGIVGARFAWYAGVGAIVAGHVVAVVLAHLRALRTFPARRPALRSQVPLTALMVAYTFVSLSILAEPITERRPAAPASASAGGAIAIPADAVLPEPGDGRLQLVGAGRTAREKLTYRVLGSAFHDGSKMSAADVLYAYAFAYRWGARGESGSAHYDPAIAAATAPMRAALAGVRLTGIDTTSKSFRVADVDVVRELLIFDVYLASAPDDPEQDAAIAPPWTAVPWHVLALMEEAVSRGWAAFSQAEATRRGVEWLDLVRSEALGAKLASLVDAFAREGWRPEPLRSLVSVDEARRRWVALGAFYKAHGHFLVADGPYVLQRWSEGGVALAAFRDLTYPLGVGSYDAYAIPRRGFVAGVERDANALRIRADIETVMKFQRSYEIRRQPLSSIDPEERRRAAPECRYAVVDGAGRVVRAGVAQPADDATFRVDLGGPLAPGGYTVLAEILVAGNAANAEIERIPFAVPAAP